MEIGPSPQKHSKSFESRNEREQRIIGKWTGMSIRERCLMMERALYAEDELLEISEDYHEI